MEKTTKYFSLDDQVILIHTTRIFRKMRPEELLSLNMWPLCLHAVQYFGMHDIVTFERACVSFANFWYWRSGIQNLVV